MKITDIKTHLLSSRWTDDPGFGHDFHSSAFLQVLTDDGTDGPGETTLGYFCPESVEPHWTHGDYLRPYAAEIPGQCRIAYMPKPISGKGLLVKGLSADAACRAFYFDPATGTEYELPGTKADGQGHWQAPAAPIFQDWILVLEQS